MTGESVTGGAYTGQPVTSWLEQSPTAQEQAASVPLIARAVGDVGSLGANVRLDARILGDAEYDRAVSRHRIILDNLEAHESALPRLPLGDDMRESFHRLSFGRSVGYLRELPSEQTTRGLFLMQPTNYGKTVYGAKFLGAAGVGTGLRAVWLTDSADGVVQAVGRKNRPNPERKQGFLDFIPEVSTDVWASLRHADKALSSITAMTYALFQRLSPKDRQRLWYMTDILACDEADCALGADRVPKIKEFMVGKLAIFLSATKGTTTGPKAKIRKVPEVFDVPTVDGMSPREALGAGIINGCKLFFVADYQRRRKAEAKAGMLPEADNPALDIVTYEAEHYGHRGFVMTNRGGDECYSKSTQARHLADRLNEVRIIDPKTGNLRNLRAVAVGTFLGRSRRYAIRDQYEAGELDVLVASDMLIRGVDSPLSDFLVAARNVESLTVMTQFFGRGARHKDHLTRCYQIIDPHAERARQLITFLHVLDVHEDTRLLQGMEIGRPGFLVPQARSSRSGGGKPDAPESNEDAITLSGNRQKDVGDEDFPEQLRDAIGELQGRILSEVTGLAVKDIPDAWPTAQAAMEEFGFKSRGTLLSQLDKYRASELTATSADDMAVSRYVLTGDGYRINPLAMAWLRQHGLERAKLDRFIPMQEACTTLGVTEKIIRRSALIAGVSLEERRHADPSVNKPILGLTAGEFALLKAYFAENYKPYDPRVEISVSDLAVALNRSKRGITLHIDDRNDRRAEGSRLQAQLRKTPGLGTRESCLPALPGRTIMAEMGRRMPEGAVPVPELPAEVIHALATSPYRWRVVHQFLDYREQRGNSWLVLDDHKRFMEWLAGSRQEKSASGIVEERARLTADEFSQFDKALFRLGSPMASQGLRPELSQRLATVLLHPKGLRRLESWEQTMLGNLLIGKQSALEVVFGQLVPAGRVPLPERPHVTDVPQFFGEQLDILLVDMIRRMQ